MAYYVQNHFIVIANNSERLGNNMNYGYQNEEDFVKKIGELEYIVEGSLNLEDFNDRLDLDLSSNDYDSVISDLYKENRDKLILSLFFLCL